MVKSCTSFDIEGNFQVNRPMFRVMALASLIVLAELPPAGRCAGRGPNRTGGHPGDGQVTVTWDQQPGLTYWIFFNRAVPLPRLPRECP